MSSAEDSPQGSYSNDARSKTKHRIRWRFVLIGFCLLFFAAALYLGSTFYYSSSFSQVTDAKNVKIVTNSSARTDSPTSSFDKQNSQTGDLSEIDAKQFNLEKINHVVSVVPQKQQTPPNKPNNKTVVKIPPPIGQERGFVTAPCPKGKIAGNMGKNQCGYDMKVTFKNGAYYDSFSRVGTISVSRGDVIWDLSGLAPGTYSIIFSGRNKKIEIEKKVTVNPCECVSPPDNTNTETGNRNPNTNGVNDSSTNINRANNTNHNINANVPTPTVSPTVNGLVNVNANNTNGSTGDKFSYTYPSRFIKDTIYTVCLSLQPGGSVNLCENPVGGALLTRVSAAAFQKTDPGTYVTADLKFDSGLEIVGKPEHLRLPYNRDAPDKDLPIWIWKVKLSEDGENLDEVALNFECKITSGKQDQRWESGELESGVGLPVWIKITTPLSGGAGMLGLVGGVIPRKRRRRDEEEISDEAGDEVHATTYAPAKAKAGSNFKVQVFAHLLEQAADVEKAAADKNRSALRQETTKLDEVIERGSKLTFSLRMPGLEIDEPVQTYVWTGEFLEVHFIIFVPKDYPLGESFGKIIVSENTLPIGRLNFTIEIVSTSAETTATTRVAGNLSRYQAAFISYASKDRPEVLKRVQMLKAQKTPFFQDMISLNPGDRWKKELYKNIDKCDVLYLFWSEAAKESEWVTKEVLYAYQLQGGKDTAPPDIIPIPIEGPPPVKPPDTLSFLHFNDEFIYLIYAAEAERKASEH
jgi:hypothetical protein